MAANAAAAAAAAAGSAGGTEGLQFPHENLRLQDLFIEQAKKTPDALAVVDGDTRLTYAQLDRLTDKLAAVLHRDHLVRPDSVVGILMPRCAEYVIAYVAILKAGGAYMPLEIVYPRQLLERAISQTETPVVITQAPHDGRLPTSCPRIVLDNIVSFDVWNDTEYATEELTPEPTPDNLAFVVMSSGTTGTPKGICQVHRSAVHSYCDRFNRYPYYSPDSTETKQTANAAEGSQGVDDRVGAGVFFVWELYRPLCRGATCVVIPDHVIFDPDAVTQYIVDENITRILFTPSLLQLIMDTVAPEEITRRFAGLRYLWLCGEVVTVELVNSFTRLVEGTELLNLYSISECHDVSIGDLRRQLDQSREYATCGLKIPGVRVYVVNFADEERKVMRKVKVGDAGEVFVGGPVLARGYLKMPEKTAERFVPNPFVDEDPDSPRLYQTGDMGCILPESGELEIIGRCDFMVKIRGYSVVLSAVEAALAKHPKLRSAVVLAIGAEGTDKKLVAYVVPETWEHPPSAADVRRFLKSQLPPYAIPGTFCVIDAMPVNASAAGKLDRKKLPSPEAARKLKAFDDDEEKGKDNPGVRRVAPSGRWERMVTEVWCNLLGISADEVSTVDSFFDVGGHSLLATRLAARLNDTLVSDAQLQPRAKLSLNNVVEGPTIKEIAACVQILCAPEDSKVMGKDGAGETKLAAQTKSVDLSAEAEALDSSIYPAATRKSINLSRFRINQALLPPRVVFLTGATGYLGAHILHELLTCENSNITVVCLVRAADAERGRDRLLKTLSSYRISVEDVPSEDGHEASDAAPTISLLERVVVVAGDLSKPLLGMDAATFKSLAGEIDSIIHCGAQVNLVKPYAALKAANVLGTQEILRLATTNGILTTKVKPVHYISTNGIFPTNKSAYKSWQDSDASAHITCSEDAPVSDVNFPTMLTEGYAMSKWVAERMCDIAAGRGSPVSVIRPGNMAGSTATGAQNPSDFVYLFVSAMLAVGCCPDEDMATRYAFDLTPVDFAAKAVAHLAASSPGDVIGRRVHLQSPHEPVLLGKLAQWLRASGHKLESVSRDDWVARVAAAAQAERNAGVQRSPLQQVESGFEAFESYFEASTWLRYGCKNLVQALRNSGISCPAVDQSMIAQWFPVSSSGAEAN